MTDQRSTPPVVVVTGAGSGIGRATAERFLAAGAAVVLGDVNEANAARVLDELSASHRARARFVPADVSREPDVDRLVRAAVDEFGRIDVMFNNAGVGGAFGELTDIEVDDFDYTFAVLVRGVFLGMKHATRQFLEQGDGGSIVNTSSVAALSGGAAPLAYSAAKAAVINLTRSAAVELGPRRIRVNAVVPGPILTPLMHGGRPDDAATSAASMIPWPHVGQPDDIASVVLFLAGPDSGFITGEAIVVDGGMTAAGPRATVPGGPGTSPPGFVGVNRGTTGEPHVVRRRP